MVSRAWQPLENSLCNHLCNGDRDDDDDAAEEFIVNWPLSLLSIATINCGSDDKDGKLLIQFSTNCNVPCNSTIICWCCWWSLLSLPLELIAFVNDDDDDVVMITLPLLLSSLSCNIDKLIKILCAIFICNWLSAVNGKPSHDGGLESGNSFNHVSKAWLIYAQIFVWWWWW